jgi:ABC-type antimicrobial peptide transport system permease subunit
MENLGTGAGLGALGFWLFIASVIAVGVWYDIRRREAQHETLRRIIESGQPIDETLVDKILSLTSGNRELARDLWVSGLIMLCIAPGLVILGWALSVAVKPTLLIILLGVAALVAFIAAGLLIASRVARRWQDSRPPADHARA